MSDPDRLNYAIGILLCDAGPALKQHWLNFLCLLGYKLPCRAKPKGSNSLLKKEVVTAFWACRAVLQF